MGRQKKIAAPQVMVSLDFGGSGLKAIATNSEKESLVVFMEPEVIEATVESLQQKTQGSLNCAAPENLAWVGVGEDYRAVGYLAASRYHANAGLSKKKYTSAVYRTLAALWVIREKLELPSAFEVSLGVLLPPGEFGDSQLLLAELLKALQHFETPTGKMTVILRDFLSYPEGAGVYLMHSHSSGEALKRSVMAVVMVGYRNASVLVSRRGVIDNGRTTNLGMVRLVELVQEKTSGLKTAPLIKAIAASSAQPEVKHFLGLTEFGRSSEVRRAEADKIVEAVISARTEYLTALGSWLAEVLPIQELDEVVFCGGTADYLKSQLDSCFPATPVKWHGEFKMPSDWGEQWLGNRLADLPVAYAAGELSDEERERIAWESVFALLRQVDYLCSVFKLDRTCFGIIRPLGVEPIERMATTKPKKKRTQQLEQEDTSALSGFEFLYSLNEKFTDSSDENN